MTMVNRANWDLQAQTFSCSSAKCATCTECWKIQPHSHCQTAYKLHQTRPSRHLWSPCTHSNVTRTWCLSRWQRHLKILYVCHVLHKQQMPSHTLLSDHQMKRNFDSLQPKNTSVRLNFNIYAGAGHLH